MNGLIFFTLIFSTCLWCYIGYVVGRNYKEQYWKENWRDFLNNFKIRIVGGYQNTKDNKEDIALTPFVFGVWAMESQIKIIGIGICWLHCAVYIGIGKGIPKGFPLFSNCKIKTN